jgi:ABC-2 type transport system permease protein
VDKKIDLLHILRLYLLYAKMDLAWVLRDTKYAMMALLADTISNVSSVFSVFMLAWRFDGVGGMSKYEVLFMLGYITIMTGVILTFWSNNISHISRRIGRGQLEHMMIQPLSLPVQLITEGFYPFSGSSNLITGSVVMIIALNNLGITVTWWWVGSLILNLMITTLIILSQSYIFSSAAFYAPVAAEEISSYVIDLGGELSKYPLSGMPRGLAMPLLTILPTGLLGWFPTLALLGRPPLELPYIFPVTIAIALFLIAQFTFRKGLKHYVKTGSNRYLPYGHRR